MDAILPVHHEEDEIRLLHGRQRLVAHLPVQRLVASFDDPAGVHDEELPACPICPGKVSVPGHPGLIVDDGRSFSQDPIEECGLPYIGASDHGHDWESTIAHSDLKAWGIS
jgi:hypothetical protein